MDGELFDEDVFDVVYIECYVKFEVDECVVCMLFARGRSV